MTKKTVMKKINRTGLYGCLWWIKWNSKVWQRNIQLWSFATFQNVHQHQRIFSDNKLHLFLLNIFPAQILLRFLRNWSYFLCRWLTSMELFPSLRQAFCLGLFVCLKQTHEMRQDSLAILSWLEVTYCIIVQLHRLIIGNRKGCVSTLF